MSQTIEDRMIALGLADAPACAVRDASPDAAPVRRKPPLATASIDAGFVEPPWFPVLAYAMKSEKGVSLFGPRGCGKSSAILELAARCKRTVVVLQCCANMQLDGLLGTWAAEGGSTKFIEGPLAIAVRNGSWLVAEESNVIHPGVWSAVNTLTDATGHGLRLPTGEVIPPHPNFRLALLYNDGYAGTREVNAALKDRLMPIYCDYMSHAQESQMLANRTGAPAYICDAVTTLAGAIRSAAVRMDLSPRAMMRLMNLVGKAGMSWTDAYGRAVLDLAGSPDTAAAQRAVLSEIARQMSIENWSTFALADDDEPADEPLATASGEGGD